MKSRLYVNEYCNEFAAAIIAISVNALVGYRAEFQDSAYLNVLSVDMNDTVVNDITVVESGEIVRM